MTGAMIPTVLVCLDCFDGSCLDCDGDGCPSCNRSGTCGSCGGNRYVAGEDHVTDVEVGAYL